MMNYGWQTDPSLWTKISDHLRDDAWRFVAFAEIEAVAVPAGESGIYVFCVCPVGERFSAARTSHRLFGNLFTPMYVGRTGDLRRRFVDHCRRPSPKVRSARRCFGDAMTFWFRRLEEDRIGYDEAVLIRCFGPTANDRDETIAATLGAAIDIGIHNQKLEGEQ